MLRVFALFEQAGHCDGRGWANVLPPVNRSLRRPLDVRPVRGRHVLADGGKAAASDVTDVTGHALPAMQNFDGASGYPRFQCLPHQPMRHAPWRPLLGCRCRQTHGRHALSLVRRRIPTTLSVKPRYSEQAMSYKKDR